jgi:drug/metabolite transporter, DME family
MVALVEQARGRRTAGKSGVVTTAVALAGLGMLIGLPGGAFGAAALLAGAGMALLSAAGFAAVTLIGTWLATGLDELTLNGFGFSLGGLALLPLAAVLGGSLGLRPSLPTAGLLAAVVAAVRADSAASGQRSPAAALCSPTPK